MSATTAKLNVVGPMPSTFAISSFPAPALTSTTPTLRIVTLDELVKLLTTHERRRNKNGRGWSGAKYKPGTTRANGNVIEWSVAAGDFDHLTMDEYMELRATLVAQGLAVILYSTYNSTPGDFRFRLAIPMTKPIPRERYTDVWQRINATLFLGKNDENTKDASRMLFTLAAPADAAVVAEYIPGEALDWEKLPEAPASSRKSTLGAATAGQDVGVSKDVLWFTIDGVEAGQQRRMALRAARSFLSTGKTVEETVDLIWRGLQASPVGDEANPWTEDQAREIVEDLADREPTPLNEWPDFPVDDLPAYVRNGHASGPTLDDEGGTGWFSPHDTVRQNGRAETSEGSGAAALARPTIRVSGRDPRDVAEDGVRAIRAANDPEPRLFVRGGGLVRTRTTELGRPMVSPLDRDALFHTLLAVAQWERYDLRAKDWRPTGPPDDVVRYISGHRDLPFPALAGITEAPIIRPDGTIVTTAGYDPATRLIYRPAPGLMVPPVPDRPSEADVVAARDMIDELVYDFAFAEDGGDGKPSASRANAYALLLTLVVRSAIVGPTPIAAINKNSPGAGATLLIEVFGMVAHGRAPGLTALPGDDGELEKRITTLLRDGEPLNVFDNVDRTLEHGSLSLVLTATEWAGRILGKSETGRYPNRAIWTANGVNLTLRGDIARRAYEIRIVVDDTQPWRLEGGERRFRHPKLMEWAEEHRGGLLGACLTLARNWYANRQPAPSTPTLGKFEDWCRVIGGILEAAGIGGFLGNLDALYHNVDAESPEWSAFLTAWFDRYGSAEVTAKQVEADLKEADAGALLDTLPGELASALNDPRSSFAHRLGRALTKRVERRYGEKKLRILRGGNAGQGKWRVEPGFPGFPGFSATNAGDFAGGAFHGEGPDGNPGNPGNPTPDADLCRTCGVNTVDLIGLDCDDCMGTADG